MNFKYGIDLALRYAKLYKYKRKYGFSSWHMEPVSAKPYVSDVLNYIKTELSEGDTVVECGCGLGDIIGNESLKNCSRKGIDIKKEVINADIEIYKKEIREGSIDFEVGSFDLVEGEEIDCFIALNFLHTIEPNQIEEIFTKLLSTNRIRQIIVDTVQSPTYEFNHKYDYLNNSAYQIIDIGEYEVSGGTRKVSVYRIA